MFVVGLVVYSMAASDIEDLIICSVNIESHRIPTDVCELYLINFRGTSEDIQFLESRSGIAFVFAINDKIKRASLLEFLLAKGASVNKQSAIDGYYPLHSAVIMNDHALVDYLIVKGAEPRVKDRDHNLTVLELLNYLQEHGEKIDRSKVYKALSKGLSKDK